MSDIVEVMARAIREAVRDVADVDIIEWGSDRVARAALAALEQAGYAVVPVVPTEAMVKAGGGALKSHIDGLSETERSKLRKMKGRDGAMLGYRIAPQLKCQLRWSAMIAVWNTQRDDPTVRL